MKSRNLNRNLRIVLKISEARESGQKRLGMIKEYLEGHCGYRVVDNGENGEVKFRVILGGQFTKVLTSSLVMGSTLIKVQWESTGEF